MHLLHFSFLLSSFGGITSHSLLSTDARFFVFPGILVSQVFVGVMGNTPPIWVHGVGDISDDVILSCWFLYICTFLFFPSPYLKGDLHETSVSDLDVNFKVYPCVFEEYWTVSVPNILVPGPKRWYLLTCDGL